jgi:Potential Queuosine, Q, salvage protein family
VDRSLFAMPGLCDSVRRHCASVAAGARDVAIDADREIPGDGTNGLDPQLHFLEGPPEDVARYVLILDAINFGSGWFDELRTGTNALTERLTTFTRKRGEPWSAAELRALGAQDVAEALGLNAQHELTLLYAQGLNQLGALLGEGGALALAGDSAEGCAERLAAALPFFADHGFFKRAQIAAHDLHLSGAVDYPDTARLTAFADNLVPHVLRSYGVLTYSDALAALVDAGRELPAGSRYEREIRAAGVHACELLSQRLGLPPATLDNRLWNAGQDLPGRPHRTKTVFY